MNWEELEKKLDSKEMKEHMLLQGVSISKTINKEMEKIMDVANAVRRFKRFVFSGCGDKHVVPLITEFLWRNVSDKPLDVIHSRVLADFPPRYLDESTCVVFISQSGTTKDTVEACKTIIEKGCKFITITNLKERKEDSLVDLAEKYDGCVIRTHTKLYPETPLPSTGTFHTSLAVLNLLTMFINDAGEKLFDFQVNIIPNVVDKLSKSISVIKECRELGLKMRKFNDFYVVGDGPRFPVARKQAKIMLMEGVKTNACDVELEEFVHSLIETLESQKKNPLILLKPLDRWLSDSSLMNYKIVKNLWEKVCGRGMVFEIDPFAFLNEDLRRTFSCVEGNLLSPFLYAVVLGWLTYYLALAKNVDPGVGKLVKKVRSKKEMEGLLS